MVDHSSVKLGKLDARANFDVLRFSAYARALPPPPPLARWSEKVNYFGAMGNHTYGDCVFACAGHAIQTWTAWTKDHEVTIPDRDILAAYSAVTGFDPRNPRTDKGAVIDDFLTWWLANPMAGHLLSARTAIGVGDLMTIKQGIYMLGGVDVGARLPRVAQRQEIWDVPPGGPVGDAKPGTWGGHCMWAIDYEPAGVTFVTWGVLKRATWRWWQTYVDEAHGLLSKDWICSGKTPTGLDWDHISADLRNLATG